MTDVQLLAELFTGYSKAHGTYSHTERNEKKGGKLEIKKSARTVAEPITEEMWGLHVEGSRPLGVIPIDENGNCKWACIDYDSYDVNHGELVDRVAAEDFPLIVCKTKSGGAHLFTFFKDWEPAEYVISVMRNMSAKLGLGNSEIFPKQSQVLYDKGDFGNWLNMPYFGDSARKAVKSKGLAMSLADFVKVAENMKVSLDDINVSVEVDVDPDDDDQTMKDGPPCLQFLSKAKVGEGGRNKALTAFAIFAKKKYQSNWQDVVVDMNQRYMKEALDNEEVQRIINSVAKKDYKYACKDSPLCDHCVSRICITRRFGVGGDDAFPTVSGLSVLNTDPRLWFLDVGDQRICIETDDLINYRRFHKVCMEQLFVVYPLLKQETWNDILKDAMASVVVIDQPAEVSISGIFREYVEEFCVDMVGNGDRSDIQRGRVWLEDETDTYFFRLQNLDDFLQRKNFKHWGRPRITTELREMGGETRLRSIGGSKINIWSLPRIREDDAIPTPETPESTL